jgi:hypothetical protein
VNNAQSSPAAADVLDVRCSELATKVCTFTSTRVRRALQQVSVDGEAGTSESWSHYGSLAAFLAFMKVGGDVSNPDNIDWESQLLFKTAVSLMQKLTLGSASDHYDKLLRERGRRAHVDEVCWSSWKQGVYDKGDDIVAPSTRTASRAGINRVALRAYHEFDDALNAGTLDGNELVRALQAILKPREVQWLLRRYRDGEATADIAKDLVDTEDKYQGPGGLAKAISVVDVAIHRAKKRARHALPQRWLVLAQEVV